MSQRSVAIETPNWNQALFKQVVLAFFTGGVSLLVILARKLPAFWERVHLLRAQWIEKGKDPRKCHWLGWGWVAVLSTVIVSIPASMCIVALASLFLRHPVLRPGQHMPASSIAMAMVFMATFFAMFGLITIWIWHSIRMATAYFWAYVKAAYQVRSL